MSTSIKSATVKRKPARKKQAAQAKPPRKRNLVHNEAVHCANSLSHRLQSAQAFVRDPEAYEDTRAECGRLARRLTGLLRELKL